MFKKSLLYACIFIFSLSAMVSLWAQPVIKAEVDAAEYHTGDLIRVRVNMENNPGLHSIFFYLEYDEDAMTFEDIRNGSVVHNALDKGELLYADNSATSGFSTTKMVVSFSLNGPNVEIDTEGCIAELVFRAGSPSSSAYKFHFTNGKVLDGQKEEITGADWVDSREFYIVTPYSGEFLLIKRPYVNEVFYTDNAHVSLICSQGNYLVRIKNIASDYDSGFISVQDGKLFDVSVPLVTGVNRIDASLYNSDEYFLTDHSVRVLRSVESDIIEITNPKDHALLNTDMVNVQVESSLPNVFINGENAIYSGGMYSKRIHLKNGFNTITATGHKDEPDNILYSSTSTDLGTDYLQDTSASWTPSQYAGKYVEIDGRFCPIIDNTQTVLSLDAGGNELGVSGNNGGAGFPYRIRSTKETAAIANIVYKDTVVVFYQKDTSLFRILVPEENQGFKPGEYSLLSIRGEIDSLYKPLEDPYSQVYEKNIVTLEIIHTPYNLILDPVTLYNGPAVVTEAEPDYQITGSAYIFYNAENIPLQGLSDGGIEITAYKNKAGTAWEDKITRYVYVDNQRLWINLVQPNVFTSDLLDSDQRIKAFNEEQLPAGNACVTEQGEIRLGEQDPVIDVQNVTKFAAMTEAPDGTLYGLVNPSTSMLKIYKKELKDTDWSLVVSRTGMYGYDLCYTRIGLLAGVSNIPSNGNSGLYLLSGTNFINITLPGETIYHAQFVRCQERIVSVFGNLYNYLYSFSIDRLEEENGRLNAKDIVKVPFSTMYNIKEFVLSEDRSTAVIRTSDSAHNIRFYAKGNAGYTEVSIPDSNGNPALLGKSIVYGPYDDSNYEVYMIPAGDDTAEVIMKNRSTGKYFRRQKNLQDPDFASGPFDTLMGCGFFNNQFYFLYKYYDALPEETIYFMERGQVFFERFFYDTSWGTRTFTFSGTGEIEKYQEKLFITSLGSVFAGINSKAYSTLADDNCYHFYREIESSGTCSFYYINEDVEGITGFEFEVDPRWLKGPGYIDFGFDIYERTGEYPDYTDTPAGTGLASVDIHDLLEDVDAGTFSSDIFTLSHYYSDRENKEIIHCEFNELQETDQYITRFLGFSFTLHGTGQGSPGVCNIEVFKKVKAKIANSEGETIILPVQGFIYDRTVEEVSLYTSTFLVGKALVGKNGHFTYNLTLDNAAGDSVDISLFCQNALGDTAEISFVVDIIDSKNDIWDVYYGFDGTTPEECVPENESFLIETNDRTLSLSGKYFGLAGAVMGYELYSTQQGEESFLLKQGVFTKEPVLDIAAFTGRDDLGLEYEAGTFSGTIYLFPNEQRLVIYVENPGGLRYDYTAGDGLYPVFCYSMPMEEQEIIFHAEYPENATVDGIPIEDKIIAEAFEQKTPPYTFTCSEVITGEIIALEQFDELLVRSYSEDLVFENGNTEMIIPVEPGNRFAIPFTATPGDGISATYDIAAIPTFPVYYDLKKGVRVVVKKNFTTTTFIPDFSAIHPDNWDEDQKSTLKNIPIRFTFVGRDDIPLGGRTKAVLTVNFQTEITGFVRTLDSTYYCLVDEADMVLDLEGINKGKNRIQWLFEYTDEDTGNVFIMSSSYSGVQGMEDYIFTFDDTTVCDPTTITFTPALSDNYYDSSTLPTLTITKDASTSLVIFLNATEVWRDTEQKTELIDFNLYTTGMVREGRNELEINATDKYGNVDNRKYTFLFDSKPPVVNIASVKMNQDYTVMTELTATVKEANFYRAYLHYGPDIMNEEPKVVINGEDAYTIIWQDIESLGLDPSIKTIIVRATDRAGGEGSDSATGFLDITRPGEVEVREQFIDLPVYTGTPITENEDDYAIRPFPEHTKFAPEKLLEKISVRDIQKILASDNTGFGSSIAISGNYVIIGTPGDDDKESNAGAAYIFEKEGSVWIQKEKLLASDGAAGDYFGRSVAISGEYAIISVGAQTNWTTAGAAYIFERDPQTGSWINTQTGGEKQKLLPSDGAAGDCFGSSVSISGNYAIVGASSDDDNGDYSGSAYIFERDPQTGSWINPQTGGERQKIIASDGEVYDNFGFSVAISGNYAIVGANIDGDFIGSAYIFERDPQTGSWINPQTGGEKQKIIASDGEAGDNFGVSVAISGNYAIVGTLLEDIPPYPLNRPGKAYIFEKEGSVWIQKVKLTSGVNDHFGITVSISGNCAIVGSCGYYVNLYERDPQTGSWIYPQTGGEKQKLLPPDGPFHGFGFTVAISGKYAIVGASGDDNPGSAYVFNKDTLVIVSTDSFQQPYQKKYLVFQAAKDPFSNNLITKGDLEGKIKFEVYGLEQDINTKQIYKISPTPGQDYFVDTSGFEHYMEGLQYLYYMVEIDPLISDFETQYVNITFDPNNIIIKQGVLEVAYDNTLNEFEPYDVYVTGESGSNFSDIIAFDNAYMGTVHTDYVEIVPELKYPVEDRTVTLAEKAEDGFTLYFWLRIEDEKAADPDDVTYKRLVTFKDENGTELYHLGYRGLYLDLYDITGTPYSLYGSELIPLNAGYNEDNMTKLNTWNLVVVKINPDAETIEIIQAVEDEFINPITKTVDELPDEYLESIVSENASFYFGTEPGDFDTGFYSIAEPYYIPRLLINQEVLRLKNLHDRNAGGEREYTFNTATADYNNADHFALHHIGTSASYTQNKHYTDDYNANYSNTASGGSLIASSGHPNLFKIITDANGEYVILRDADACLFNNLSPTGGTGEFTLALINNAEEGRYYFGDKNTNYGLGYDRWYSISGEVKSIESGKKASLVMRINDVEQCMTLFPGRFHFIYDNTAGTSPSNVKVYVESTGTITLGTDMILNAGNYILPELGGYELAAASTTFAFDVSGSVDLWYKPFITNPEGFVNYDVVVFDSEYIKIGAEIPDGEEEAVFYAWIKNAGGNFEYDLTTHTKADYDWHHLQVTHDSEHGVIYFYINGNIAAFREGVVLPYFGSLEGNMEQEDNVFIGCDKTGEVFAGGYIDNVVLSKYYSTALYSDITPLEIAFNKTGEEVILTPLITPCSLTYISWIMTATDGTYKSEGTVFPIDTSSLPAGRYQVMTGMKVNGYGYENIITFNEDNIPRFNLADRTPFLFVNEETDLFFTFEYDHSYQYATEVLKYAGVGIRLWDAAKENIIAESYLIQDYIDQNPKAWLYGNVTDNTGIKAIDEWQQLLPGNDGRLTLVYPDFATGEDIPCDYIYFYFTNTFPGPDYFTGTVFPDGLERDKLIPLAALTEPEPVTVSYIDEYGNPYAYEYMLVAGIEGEATTSHPIFSEIIIEYEAVNTVTSLTFTGESGLALGTDTQGLEAHIYYDDMFGESYGVYDCTIRLKYKNITYATRQVTLTWKKRVAVQVETGKTLEIEEFSLCSLDKDTHTADFYLQYSTKLVGNLNSYIEVKQGTEIIYPEETPTGPYLVLLNTDTYTFIENIPVPDKGLFTVKITLEAQNDPLFIRTDTLTLECTSEVSDLEVVFTNSVESDIAYNDVFFSWKGYYEDEDGNKVYNPAIQYSYSFDSYDIRDPEHTLWSTWNSGWRSVRYYNLDDGLHSFYIKARYDGVETRPLGSTFFVDIHKPLFDDTLITKEFYYNSEGVLQSVTIKGVEGAIDDASLSSVTVSTGRKVIMGDNGSFTIPNCPVTKDGTTDIIMTATDRVGNYSDHTVNIDYTVISSITFPDVHNPVKYSPLTIVGKINDTIRAGLSIYAADPFCPSGADGDFTGWKKGIINPDRTFFVEDVMVNPGTKEQKVSTFLTIASVFDTGEVFKRELTVWANEILLPIELTLNTHAVEGEINETEVDISCYANVDFISSWSVDFDGDGVYDEIDITDNPEDEGSKSHSWIHTYSHIGQVTPRVRVITTDGNFFSVSDSLIIHEKIKEASHKLIDNPLSVCSYRMPDKSERIFVLKGTTGAYEIEVFTVGRNETYISARLYSINISGLAIDNPVIVRALDPDHLLVGTTDGETGILYELKANEYGNFSVLCQVNVDGAIKEITFDTLKVIMSFHNRNYLVELPLADNIISTTITEENMKVPTMKDSWAFGEKSGIAKDGIGLLAADYYNQRVIRFTNSYQVLEQFGSYGIGEKEFLTPSLIKVSGNRVFVFDETRHDIQVFDQVQADTGALDRTFVPVCTLLYSVEPGYHNYLEPEFFNSIKDLTVMTRAEGTRLYYYVLILSASSSKLAMLRLPQWEELRARVRNNKIAFIRDGEIFTAKPNGSDIKKILSSDSLPRIEGALDYPALSPDGKILVFTSRLDLYIGQYSELQNTGNPYAYDHIYAYTIEEKTLNRLSLGDLEDYEVERPVFNSNGNKLIFSGKPEQGRWQIYIYDFLTSTITQLFESDENARLPFYSPDDRFVVFSTDYDGDEDVFIIDTENTSMRVPVTNNYARDSLPVWIQVYPYEIGNPEHKIESKIAFVSERQNSMGNHQKEVYYVYLARHSDSDIRVVTKTGQDTGDDPDSAAIEILTDVVESDYPCFTGDSMGIVFEHYDGIQNQLKKFDFTIEPPEDPVSDMDYFGDAVRPAGMKNTITHFKAENVNGDEISLSWNRYTDKDIFYTIHFKPDNETDPFTEKKVFSQTGTVLKGLEMGEKYIVRVCITENNEVVASSQWKKVRIPVVVAKPDYEIDEENPYLVHLHAWKPPETVTGTQEWYFAWIIDNTEILVQKSQEFAYEFATSGKKTILLKAYTYNHEHVHMSEPFAVDIITDIVPYIDYVLAEDSSYIELNCENSQGYRIDFSQAVWSITGPGGNPLQLTGPAVIAQLNGYKRKINVNLTLPRIPVNGQQATDSIVASKVVDLDFKDLKPVITAATDQSNKQLIHFSGRDSIGNIDWYRTKWVIYANNSVLYQTEGVSTFDYLFPETNNDTVYTISLTIPRLNDGTTETISQFVSVESAPVEPQIDYEILTLETDGQVTGQKVMFDCTKSRGNNIDFTQARWSVPVAASYGEQTVQLGPTATYNLSGIAHDAVIEVALTLSRQGGIDPKTVTRIISISDDELAEAELVVSKTLEKSSAGTVCILDVFQSTGPNIDWEWTEWLIDNQYIRKGPSVRYEVPASSAAKEIIYTCTLYRFGGQPEIKTGKIPVKEAMIRPFIKYALLSSTQTNVFKLDVLETEGVNIDWERTRWYIHDGSQDVVIKQGAVITHAFAIQEEKMGYPVIVEMFFTGDTKPFVDYITIPVDGDEFLPVIQMDVSEEDPNTYIFSAESSVGNNIDWTQVKWTFMDTAEAQYGPVITHKFPVNSADKTYTVALTLLRRLSNSTIESKTERQTITIGSDEITPVVRARVYGDYLVVSAEQSGGRGVLLDRAVWSFPGEGDNVTIAESYQSGSQSSTQTGTSSSTQTGVVSSNSYTFGIEYGINAEWLSIGESHSIGNSSSTSDSEQYGTQYNFQSSSSESLTSNDSFSSSNYHTGPICRRYIGELRYQVLTLFVFRMTPEGGAEGKSITVIVDLNQARDRADAGGVSYE